MCVFLETGIGEIIWMNGGRLVRFSIFLMDEKLYHDSHTFSSGLIKFRLICGYRGKRGIESERRMSPIVIFPTGFAMHEYALRAYSLRAAIFHSESKAVAK